MPDIFKISELPPMEEAPSGGCQLVIVDENETVEANKTKRIEVDVFLSGLSTILQTVYPVGSIYTSVAATNPATLFGFGTWVAFGAGRVMVGYDASQTEFDTVEETGGAKEVTLSINQMPKHNHLYTGVNLWTNDNSSSSGSSYQGNSTNYITADAGNDEAHPNLQPYIVVHMWKRTA